MSKSRGTGVSPQHYLELGLNPEWLRYYLAAKLNDRVEDLDFNPDDFLARVNSDLVGKYVNIASRAAPFITKPFRRRAGRAAGGAPGVVARQRRRRGARDPRLRSTIASTAGRCGASWSSPTRSTATSTRRSRGSSPRIRRGSAELHRVVSDSTCSASKMLTVFLAPILPQHHARGRDVPRDSSARSRGADLDVAPTPHRRLHATS